MELVFQKHPVLGKEAPSLEQIAKLGETKEGAALLLDWHKAYHEKIRMAEEDPLNHGFELDHWKDAEEILEEKTSVIALGGNRCYDAETTYIYDPVAQKHLKASEITSNFHCYALDIYGEIVVAEAEKPYSKGFEEMFEVSFDDGSTMNATAHHEFVVSTEKVVPLKDMEIGSLVLGCEVPHHNDLPYIQASCARNYSSLIEGSQFDYRSCHSSDDERTPLDRGIDLSVSPSQDDAQERILAELHKDDPFAICIDAPSLSLLHPWENSTASQTSEQLHHNWRVRSQALDPQQKSLVQIEAMPEVVRCGPVSIDSELCFVEDLDVEQEYPLRPSGLSQSRQQFLGNLRPENEADERIRNRISEVVPCVTSKRVVSVRSIGKRPVYDHTVPEYGNYLANGVLQKNSGKTEWGARTVVRAALENPHSQIVCFAQDADASIRVQQSAVFRYLPSEHKKKQKGQVEYVNYSTKNGFTGGSLILNNGSKIFFHTYSQFIGNRSKFEGLELGSKEPKWLNIGLWLDEYLEDGELVKTMRFRLATRNALMLITVTPIDGYTPFIASFLKDCETTKTGEAELLNGEQVPLIQICNKKDAGIVYFHSILNPFGGYERIAAELKHSSREEILTRAYGIPVKSMTTLFPLFNTSVHVVDERPKITPETHTVYQIVDPAGKRSFVALWAAVDRSGYVSILKEFPDRETYGEWATFGDPKWKYGPAAKKHVFSVKGYVDKFLEIEKELGVRPFMRIGDSRFFAQQNSDSVDLFSQFGEHGIHFMPSDGQHIDTGLPKLDEWFEYNPNEPVGPLNKPTCTVHKSCGNLIYSLQNWGHDGTRDEALKDFVDLIRYLRMAFRGMGPVFHDEKEMRQPTKTWGY